jgi:hypothetical protein
MKTVEAIALANAITAIQRNDKPVKIKFGYALAINSKRLAVIFESFEASRKTLVEQYAKRNEDGTLATVEGDPNSILLEDRVAFEKEAQALLDTEVTVDLHMVSLNDAPDEVEPSILANLMPMLSE